ncbi:hypothetical protein EL09_11990 [Salmonella enterica subsp. enterica]|nr:hypothetical protein [Salmonella enterica subsp. enterica]MIF50462.1 hypothetical protein [Salmonella enterica subsp. enterica]
MLVRICGKCAWLTRVDPVFRWPRPLPTPTPTPAPRRRRRRKAKKGEALPMKVRVTDSASKPMAGAYVRIQRGVVANRAGATVDTTAGFLSTVQ